MADTFNPDSMDQTPRYGIHYPAPDNLVRQAPEQLETMATDIEGALANVDDRATDDARATIVRPTLDQLETSTPVQGQLGYVYNDPVQDQNGLYVWTGSSTTAGQWAKLSSGTNLTVVSPTLAQLQTHTEVSEGSLGLVTDDPQAQNNVLYVYAGDTWSRVPGATGQTIVVDDYQTLKNTVGVVGQLATVTADPAAYNNTGAVNLDGTDNWQRFDRLPDGTPIPLTIDVKKVGITDGEVTSDYGSIAKVGTAVIALRFDGIIRMIGNVEFQEVYKKAQTVFDTNAYQLQVTLPSGMTPSAALQATITVTVSKSNSNESITETIWPEIDGNTVKWTYRNRYDTNVESQTVTCDLSRMMIALS